MMLKGEHIATIFFCCCLHAQINVSIHPICHKKKKKKTMADILLSLNLKSQSNTKQQANKHFRHHKLVSHRANISRLVLSL